MDKFKSNRLTSFKGLCIIALLGALAFNSTRAEPADTASFRWERLEISNAARVTIIQGNEFRLWVDGSDWTSTLAGQAQGEERGWEIDGEWLRLHKFSAKELKVQQPHLREIRLKGAVALQSDGVWRDDLLRIGISGVGNVSLNLEVQEIMADVNGVGRLSLKGHCSKARIDINGPGIIDAKTFQARQAKIFIDGLGLCKMDVTDSLYAEISGGGSIRYRKEPAHLVNRISGLGSIAAWENDPSPNIEPETQAEKSSKERSSPQSGDFWTSRKAGNPHSPVLELGLAHWINPLGT
ncbi:MAG: GIN domain-containing protein, partial [Bacteroidota bacterium]